jgi:hypothetical protein
MLKRNIVKPTPLTFFVATTIHSPAHNIPTTAWPHNSPMNRCGDGGVYKGMKLSLLGSYRFTLATPVYSDK